MEGAPVEVLQHVTIFGVNIGLGTIQVDLYGGDESACGSVIYRFDDPAELREQAATLEAWRAAGTEVTYVKRGTYVVLMDEIAYLADAFGR